MSTTQEKLRAVVWAGGFLVEVARDKTLPLELRRQAVWIARHFPVVEEIELIGNGLDNPLMAPMQGLPESARKWTADCRHGPLTYMTRLNLPED